jgi:hypothetical protein
MREDQKKKAPKALAKKVAQSAQKGTKIAPKRSVSFICHQSRHPYPTMLHLSDGSFQFLLLFQMVAKHVPQGKKSRR